jgi:Polysaccharide lyase
MRSSGPDWYLPTFPTVNPLVSRPQATPRPPDVPIAPHQKGFVWAVSTLAVALSAVVAAPAADAKLLKRLDYETGNFRQWTNIQAVRGGARIVRSPRRQGRYAARFLVRRGDVSASGERAEVLYKAGERAGSVSWWKWATRFPRKFRPYRGAMNVFTTWHHTGPTCHPPVQFVVNAFEQPARLELRVSGGRFNPVTCNASGGRLFDLGRLRRARWLTFVFHVKWSTSRARGFVELWRNGRKVVPFTRVPTIYAGYSVYLKQGYYRRPSNWPSIVYHDGTGRFNSRPRSLRY